jgi:hypothetical protein
MLSKNDMLNLAHFDLYLLKITIIIGMDTKRTKQRQRQVIAAVRTES